MAFEVDSFIPGEASSNVIDQKLLHVEQHGLRGVGAIYPNSAAQ